MSGPGHCSESLSALENQLSKCLNDFLTQGWNLSQLFIPCSRKNHACLLLSNQPLTVLTRQKLSWSAVSSACFLLADAWSCTHVQKKPQNYKSGILSPRYFHRLFPHLSLYHGLPNFSVLLRRWTRHQLSQGTSAALLSSPLVCPVSHRLLGIPPFWRFPSQRT